MKTSYLVQLGIVKALWIQACEHDGIEPGARFVVLSDDNPFNDRYREEMKILFALKKWGEKNHGA